MAKINIDQRPLWQQLMLFALPLAITSLLQQLFTSADIAVIGKYCGSEALASIGATVPVINLSVNFLVGLSVGATVVVSHLFGEGKLEAIESAVHTAMSLGVVAGFLTMLMGWVAIVPVLQIMDTPVNLMPLAKVYLYTYYCSMPFLMVFNFGAAILRSQGDTKRPLACLLVASAVNIGLNLLFVDSMGILGIALATVLANALSCIILLGFMFRYKGVLRLQLHKLQWQGAVVRKILQIGMPAAMQGMVFSVSNIVIQGALNTLGRSVIAASAVALNFEMFAYFILNSFGQACVAYNGFFYGAKKYALCRRVTYLCYGLSFLVTCLGCYTVLFNYKFFLGIFSKDLEVIELAVHRLWYIIAWEPLQIGMENFAGALRGWGISLLPAIVCAFGVCVVRVIYVFTAFAAKPTFDCLLTVYPLTWGITAVGIIVVYLYKQKYLLKEIK